MSDSVLERHLSLATFPRQDTDELRIPNGSSQTAHNIARHCSARTLHYSAPRTWRRPVAAAKGPRGAFENFRWFKRLTYLGEKATYGRETNANLAGISRALVALATIRRVHDKSVRLQLRWCTRDAQLHRCTETLEWI